MKAYLRLLVGLCVGRKRSASSCQRSVLSYQSPFTLQSIFIKDPSVVSGQQSELNRFTRSIAKLIPKIYHLIPLLILVFVSCGAVLAQEPVGHTAPAAKAETEIVPLKIGDSVPDELWEMYFPVVAADSDQVQYLRLGDFKDKLIILDFWATWCGACINMIPKMDSLQKEFGDKIQFISVTYQKEEEVLPFWAKFTQQQDMSYSVPIAINDLYLRELFPHRVLPHYVWIGKDGTLKGITGLEAIHSENIEKLLRDERFNEHEKKDPMPVYDYHSPLFLRKDNESIVLKHSIVTDYIDSLGAVLFHNIHNTREDIHRITITNFSMVRLFQVALGKGTRKFNWDRTILDVNDVEKLRNKSSGNAYREWLKKGNGFCYELIMPSGSRDPFAIMEEDLRKFFLNYLVYVENRETPVLVLRRTSDTDLLKTSGGIASSKVGPTGGLLKNVELGRLNGYVDYYLKPVIDETGYLDNVDIDINADMNDIDSINKELAKYHLQYVESTRSMEFLVFKDKVDSNLFTE